jgi:hypothetical protein
MRSHLSPWQAITEPADEVNILIARNRPSGTPKVDHIAYTLANWDTDKNVKPKVEAELKRRGLQIRTTEGSLHIQDPDGFEVQMGGKRQ